MPGPPKAFINLSMPDCERLDVIVGTLNQGPASQIVAVVVDDEAKADRYTLALQGRARIVGRGKLLEDGQAVVLKLMQLVH